MELCSPAVRKGTDDAEISTRADLGILEGGGGDTLTEAVLAASHAGGCLGACPPDKFWIFALSIAAFHDIRGQKHTQRIALLFFSCPNP